MIVLPTLIGILLGVWLFQLLHIIWQVALALQRIVPAVAWPRAWEGWGVTFFKWIVWIMIRNVIIYCHIWIYYQYLYYVYNNKCDCFLFVIIIISTVHYIIYIIHMKYLLYNLYIYMIKYRIRLIRLIRRLMPTSFLDYFALPLIFQAWRTNSKS